MPTKAGTAYVDVVGNFAPLNRQIARMGNVSAQASKSFSRSMKAVNRDAEASRRRVAGLSREISGIGGAAQASSRQTIRAMRQIETSSARALKALRAVEAAQSRVAAGAQAPLASNRVRQAGGGGQTTTNATAAALVPVVSKAAVEAAAAAAARQAASRIGTIGASRNAYSTYGLARSFGYGRGASTVAGAGSLAASGLSLGKNFAGAFAKGLGPGLAMAGAEHILTSALKGDMKSAGFEAGGALVGGILGSFGGPAGAMLGAGIGAFAGDLVGGLFDSGEKTLTLQQKLAASAKQVSMAYKGLQASSRTLARSGEGVVRSHNRARKASREVVAAERQLVRMRRQFGPDSRQAAQAEQRLSAARQRSAKASKQAQRAERLHGIERKVQEKILKGTILEERHYQNQLKKNEKQLHKQIATAYQNGRSFQTLNNLKGKLAKNQKELTDSQKRQNEVLGEASKTIGPKYANFLKNASGDLLRTGRQARVTLRDIEKPARAFARTGEAGENSARRAKRGYDKLGRGLDSFSRGVGSNLGRAVGAMQSFDNKTSQALGDVRTGTNQTLVGLGVAKVNFGVDRKQIGGAIVPGSGDGDSYRTTLPAGSFVLNKKATKALGFRTGGHVPVMLEPGERTFLPHEVRAIGRPALEVANAAIPRFATGGSLTEPHLRGPDPLRTGGQAAIHKTFKAAERYIAKHRPGGISGPAPKGFKELLKKWKPSHPRWDVWQVGLLLQKMGYDVSENPHFGGVHPVHTNGSYHYSGRAIDVNADSAPGGEMAALDKLYAKLSRIPHTELLWRVADHYDHLHYAYRRGGSVQGLQRGGFAGGAPVRKLATGGNVARIVGAILLRNGLDTESAAGILGNAWQESTWNPGAIEPGTHNGGLWGFTAPPKDLASVERYAASQGVPWTNAKAQTQFMLHQLPQSMRQAMNRMSSIEDTTKYFMDEWERPNPDYANYPRRVEGAKKALRILGGVDAAAVGGGGGGGGGEKIPASYHGCQTGSLSFPALPKQLPEVNREVARRKGELGRYRKAVAAANKEGRSGVAAALEKNVRLLEDRMAKLTGERHRLRVEKAKLRFTKKLGRKLGKVQGYEQRIERKERDFNIASQDVEQLVALEPQLEQDLPEKATEAQRKKAEETYVARFTDYVNNRERSAYSGLLERVADWRNTILRAEKFGFGEGSPSVAQLQRNWEKKVREAGHRIDYINDFTEDVRKRVAKWRADHPKAKALPDWLKDQIHKRDKLREELPWLRFEDRELRKTVGESRGFFFPGGENRITPPPIPLEGSGTLEDKLSEVQGIHWPDQHDLLGAADLAPPRKEGRFGGAIWELQTSIEELGMKIRDAAGSLGEGGSDEGDSERKELEDELNKQAKQRTAVTAAQLAVLQDFNATYPVGAFPPYAGKAHSGAVVPGPPTQEKTMIVRGQERIRTPEQELAMAEKIRQQGGGDGAALPQLVVNGNIVQEPGDTRDPVEAVINDRRFPVAVRQVAMGGRLTPGGARS